MRQVNAAWPTIRHGQSETFYENLVLDVLSIKKLKDIHLEPAG